MSGTQALRPVQSLQLYMGLRDVPPSPTELYDRSGFEQQSQECFPERGLPSDLIQLLAHFCIAALSLAM